MFNRTHPRHSGKKNQIRTRNFLRPLCVPKFGIGLRSDLGSLIVLLHFDP